MSAPAAGLNLCPTAPPAAGAVLRLAAGLGFWRTRLRRSNDRLRDLVMGMCMRHPDLDQALIHNQANSAGDAWRPPLPRATWVLLYAFNAWLPLYSTEAGHDPVWFAWPAAPPKGPRQKSVKNVFLLRVYCRICKQTANQPGELAAKACQEGFEGLKRGTSW